MPKTHAERLLWLAEREIPSYPNHPWDDPAVVARTGGSGKVPRFPELRSQCRCCGGRGEVAMLSATRTRRCTICNGRGWTPVDDLEGILCCAYEWRFSKRKGEIVSATCRMSEGSLDAMGHAETYNQAAILALYQAVKRVRNIGGMPRSITEDYTCKGDSAPVSTLQISIRQMPAEEIFRITPDRKVIVAKDIYEAAPAFWGVVLKLTPEGWKAEKGT